MFGVGVFVLGAWLLLDVVFLWFDVCLGLDLVLGFCYLGYFWFCFVF